MCLVLHLRYLIPLQRKNINVDVILQSIGRAGTKDISFTVNKDDLDDAVATLEESQERLGFKELHSERNIAKLSIVGSGMLSNPGVAAQDDLRAFTMKG